MMLFTLTMPLGGLIPGRIGLPPIRFVAVLVGK
jgi:hypothetical protein